MTQQEYIKAMWRVARTVPLGNVLPSVLIAQSAVESGWGGSQLAQTAHNYFGITKGSSWNGNTYKSSTGYTFRAYKNKRQSINDYVKLLNNNYKSVVNGRTYTEQATALTQSAYSGGDANYGNKIISIIEKNNLTKYDTYYKLQLAGMAITALELIVYAIYLLKQ